MQKAYSPGVNSKACLCFHISKVFSEDLDEICAACCVIAALCLEFQTVGVLYNTFYLATSCESNQSTMYHHLPADAHPRAASSI